VNLHALEEILGVIKQDEMAATQRAIGRIEPRSRFKAMTSNTLLESRPPMTLYLDECGTSSPFKPTSPAGHSVFAVSGVAMTEEAKFAYCAKADAVKRQFWGHIDITFHEPYMRNHDRDYYFGGDTKKQQDFDAALLKLLEETDFVAFGAVVRKDAYQSEFLEDGRDAYLPHDSYSLAIALILERFVDFLAHQETRFRGRLVFESQGPRQDAEHQHSYATVMIEGTRFVPENTFMQWLDAGCSFVPKCGSHPVEVADIVSRDFYDWVRSGCTCEVANWDMLRSKIYCRDRGVQGTFGLKVFPATGLEAEVYAHRKECGAALPEGLLKD
jgi:hypothetical protein